MLGCHVSPAFDAWFARSCARNPQRRYTNVSEQVEALAEILEAAEVRLALCEERPSLICDGVRAPAPTRRAHAFACVAAASSIVLSCYALLA